MPIEPYAPVAYKRGPRGRPTRQEAERRHQSLLATATRLFLDKGWDGASVDEISSNQVSRSASSMRAIPTRRPFSLAQSNGSSVRKWKSSIASNRHQRISRKDFAHSDGNFWIWRYERTRSLSIAYS